MNTHRDAQNNFSRHSRFIYVRVQLLVAVVSTVPLLALAESTIDKNPATKISQEKAPGTAWYPEKQDSGITIDSRPVAGSSALELRAIVELNAGTIAASQFLQDPATNSQWVPGSKDVSIIERPARGVTLVHFVMEGSWPFQSRDAVARFELTQTPDDIIWIRFNSEPRLLPELAGTVRMETYAGCWRLTPQSPSRTHLEYQSHIEAGGAVPAWMANSVAIRSTYKAMQNLERLVPTYVATDVRALAFLREPVHFQSGAILPMGEHACEEAFEKVSSVGK